MRFAVAVLLCAGCAFAIERKAEPDAATLLTVKRVFVDRFGGGELAAQVRDMIINSLQSAKLFIVTENEERADVVLRGSAEDLVFSEEHSLNDNINVHANLGSSNSSKSSYGSSSSNSQGVSVGQNESSHSSERKHEASASVRMVNLDGDVIWSATKESLGGKFRGASADVADKILKQLLQDVERAKLAKIPSR